MALSVARDKRGLTGRTSLWYGGQRSENMKRQFHGIVFLKTFRFHAFIQSVSKEVEPSHWAQMSVQSLVFN